jgi:competence protein ComEC
MRFLAAVISMIVFTSSIYADQAIIKVIDSGPGLAVVGKTQNGKSFIFDLGHWDKDKRQVVLDTIEKTIKPGSRIEYVFLSHMDSDHISSLPTILKNYKVKRLIRTGQQRVGTEAGAFKAAITAIKTSVDKRNLKDLTVANGDVKIGSRFRVGSMHLRLLSGFENPPKEWGITKSDRSEWHNAGSLVLQISMNKRKIIIMGDAAGVDDRKKGTLVQPWAAEKYMIKRWGKSLKSDILIPGHHCANDASSTSFLKTVMPKAVICSAGHANNHPTKTAVERILAAVPNVRIYRTDLGDSELASCTGKENNPCPINTPSKEWKGQSGKQIIDPPGDDTVTIRINSKGKIKVTQ